MRVRVFSMRRGPPCWQAASNRGQAPRRIADDRCLCKGSARRRRSSTASRPASTRRRLLAGLCVQPQAFAVPAGRFAAGRRFPSVPMRV